MNERRAVYRFLPIASLLLFSFACNDAPIPEPRPSEPKPSAQRLDAGVNTGNSLQDAGFDIASTPDSGLSFSVNDAGPAFAPNEDAGTVSAINIDGGQSVSSNTLDAGQSVSSNTMDAGESGTLTLVDAGVLVTFDSGLPDAGMPSMNDSGNPNWDTLTPLPDAGIPIGVRCAPEYYDHDNNYWTACIPCRPPCGPFSNIVQSCQIFQNRICECQVNYVENENGDCVKESDSDNDQGTYFPNDSFETETPDGDADNTDEEDEDVDNGDEAGAHAVQSTASFAATPLWSLTFQDEFNGPQPGDDLSCYSRTPKCLFHWGWGPIDCPDEVVAQMANLNKCVWSVYDFYNYMNGKNPEEHAPGMKNAFSASEVKVENGYLVLSARTQGSSHNDCGQEYHDERTDNVNYTVDCPFLSGGVHSRHHSWAGNVSVEGFLQKHGRFEVRARLPGGPGAWPAIWMLPQGGLWPDNGEIDIMEAWAHKPGKVYGTYHDGVDAQEIKTKVEFEHRARSRFYPQSGRNDTFEDDFHVYAVEWDENELRFYVDKWYVGTFYNGQNGESGDTDFVMTLPTLANYIILNYTIKADIGSWDDNFPINYRPDLDDFQPREMLIDYVRVYERNEPEMSIACPWGGTYDGANCQLASVPSGVAVYIKDSSLYSIAASSAPYCPQGVPMLTGRAYTYKWYRVRRLLFGPINFMWARVTRKAH